MIASLGEEGEEGETVTSLTLIPERSFQRASSLVRTDSGSLAKPICSVWSHDPVSG